MPPSCAMAIASGDSVTVSIAAETSGMLSWMLRVSRVLRLTLRGRTLEWAGTRRTSSKVRAFWTQRSEEHTSELQSRLHLVCRLLLEKKKNKQYEECHDS